MRLYFSINRKELEFQMAPTYLLEHMCSVEIWPLLVESTDHYNRLNDSHTQGHRNLWFVRKLGDTCCQSGHRSQFGGVNHHLTQ